LSIDGKDNGLLDSAASVTDYMGMSEDRAPYKRPGQPQEISESDEINRVLRVHRDWIFADGLRIIKLADRVHDLERGMAELKETIDHMLTPGVN